MSKDNIIKLIQPGNVDDQLTEILRNGARALLAQAVMLSVGLDLRMAPVMPKGGEMVCKTDVTPCHRRLPIRHSLQKFLMISKDEI